MVNAFSIYLLHEDSHHSLNLRGIVFHGVADAASSLGVMLSSLAVYFDHWIWADAAASLLVALLIGITAVSLVCDGCWYVRSEQKQMC